MLDIFSNNASNMFYGSKKAGIISMSEKLGQATHLIGTVSEIGRCCMYGNGKKLQPITGKLLAKIFGFSDNPCAINGFEQWLNVFPKGLSYYSLDIAYWEHRLGVWHSCGLTYREALLDQIPPMNIRKFADLSLSVAIKDRLPPHNLIRDVIRYNHPGLLTHKFNNQPHHSILYSLPLLRKILKWTTKQLRSVWSSLKKLDTFYK